MPKTTLNTLTHIYVSCLLFISILLLPLMVTQSSIFANEQTDDEEARFETLESAEPFF